MIKVYRKKINSISLNKKINYKQCIHEERGSFTVEATITLTVYLMAVIVFINWLMGVDVSAHVYGAMYKGAYEISTDMTTDMSVDVRIDEREDIRKTISKDIDYEMNNSTSDKSEIAKNRIKQIMDEDYIEKSPIIKGLEGIDISYRLGGLHNENIQIMSKYGIDIPFLPYTKSGFLRKQNLVCRAFTGDIKNKSNKKFVYVTKSGTVYHTDVECTYILVKRKRVLLEDIESYRNSSGAKYDKCKECKNEVNNTGYVYITNYGTSYHNLYTCSTITRTVRAVEMSDIKGKKACEKCVEGR